MKKYVAVIGGGIAGTAAAHYLTERGYKVIILEKNNYLGGRIKSVESDGAVFEMGAGFMTNAYTNILTFIRENSLEGKRYGLDGRSGILRGDKVRLATANNLLSKDTLSWSAKMQALPLLCRILLRWRRLDVHHPLKAKAFDARTVDELFAGRSGKEFLEYVMQPVLNGYFYWSPEETNEAIVMMIGKALIQGGAYRLEGGLKQLAEVAANRAKVLLDHEVSQIFRLPSEKFKIAYKHEGKVNSMQVDGVVCATTASVAVRIIPDLSQRQRSFLDSVRYSSTVVMAQTYERSQTKGDKGIAFPRREGYHLAAVTVSPDPGLEVEPMASVKAYASGAHAKDLLALNDQALINRLIKELSVVRGVVMQSNAASLSTHIQRWPEALPIFDRGYYHRLESFIDNESSHEGLVFAGDYIGGPLMEGAFTSGVQAADKLDAFLSSCAEA